MKHHEIYKTVREFIGSVIVYKYHDGIYELRREALLSDLPNLEWFRKARKSMKEQLRVAKMLERLGVDFDHLKKKE